MTAPRRALPPEVVACVLLVGVAAAVLLSGAGFGSIQNSDDGIAASVIRGMARGEGLLELHYQGAVEHQRPLLFFWMAAGVVRLLGPSEFALRLVPCLATVAAVLLTFLLARRIGASLAGALLAATLVLLIHLPVRTSRRVGEDALLAAWLAGALLAYLRSEERPRAWLWWGALVGLAIDTKGVVASLAVLAIAPDLLWRRRPVLATRWPWAGAAVALAVAAPWHLVETVRFGREFWGEYLGYNVWRRAVEAHLLPRDTGPLFYVEDLFAHDLVLATVLLLGIALLVGLQLRARRLPPATVVALSALVVPLLLFSVARSRLPHYMLPAYVPAAALAGSGWSLALESRPGGRFAIAGLIGLVAGVGLWLRADDLAAPDYAPADKRLALAATLRLPPSEPLYVFDHYHTSPAFYADRPVIAAISMPEAYDKVTISRLLVRTGRLRHMDARALGAVADGASQFCALLPTWAERDVRAAIRRPLDEIRDAELVLLCAQTPLPASPSRPD